MLRLWPKEVQIGLFAGQCWLRVGRTGPVREYAPADSGPDAMLDQLASMLDDPSHPVPKGLPVVLTVSDSLAAVLCMQWMPTLQGDDEIRRYAEICFERQGRDVGNGWLLRAEYRQFQGGGMAYALPVAWVEGVDAVLRERDLHLRRLLPASAALHFADHPRLPSRRLSLLVEAQRVSALSYSRGLLDGLDVEPVTDFPEDALRRLLSRASVPVEEVSVWAVNGQTLASVTDGVQSALPDARIVTLFRERLHAA